MDDDAVADALEALLDRLAFATLTEIRATTRHLESSMPGVCDPGVLPLLEAVVDVLDTHARSRDRALDAAIRRLLDQAHGA